jgi:hypothetical protein
MFFILFHKLLILILELRGEGNNCTTPRKEFSQMPVPIAESATTYVYQQVLTTSKVLFFAYTWHMRFYYAMIQDRRTCL